MRSVAALVWILILVAAISIAGVVLWWYLAPREGVVAYLKIPRDTQSLVIDTAAIGNESYRQRKANHRTLLASPLVLEAAFQRQEIANLDVVRSHDMPSEWLSDVLEITFPEDSEVMEVFLPCAESDSEGYVMLLDAVLQAYSDKVLFQDRIVQATAVSELRSSIQDLEGELHKELTKQYQLRRAVVTSEEMAQLALLKDACRSKRQLLRELKRTALQLEVDEKIAANAERSGNSRPGTVSVILRPTWTVDSPSGLYRYHPHEAD